MHMTSKDATRPVDFDKIRHSALECHVIHVKLDRPLSSVTDLTESHYTPCPLSERYQGQYRLSPLHPAPTDASQLQSHHSKPQNQQKQRKVILSLYSI
jgi:hypothetical protein